MYYIHDNPYNAELIQVILKSRTNTWQQLDSLSCMQLTCKGNNSVDMPRIKHDRLISRYLRKNGCLVHLHVGVTYR